MAENGKLKDNYVSVKGEVAGLLSETGNFLAVLTADPSEVLGKHLTFSFQQFSAAKKKAENETIDCALMALTKSGKSTLINAFCGDKLMPSNNVPETARITSVEHQSTGLPTLQYSTGGELIRVEGADNIYDYQQYLNGEVRGRAHRKEDEQILTVKAAIAALQEGEEGEEGQQVRLRLLDTPGTNEAGEDRLRHSVERLLDSVDAVVFLMDYGKLKTSEEATMLAKLKEKNPQLVNRLAQRLFFVVNKIDCIHSSSGQEEEELREYVAELVTSQMNSESFHLGPEQVLLVSAQEALLARLVLQGKASEEDKAKFAYKVWGSSFARSRRSKSQADYMEQAEAMLEDSRLPELEESLLSYLYNNAGGIKLQSQADTITQLLLEVQNVAMTGKAALQQSTGQLQRESKELQAKLQTTLDRFAEVQRDANLVEASVIDNVQYRMQSLKERLFEHVAEVLDGVEQPRLPGVKTGPWKKIWEKSVKFITRSGAQDNRSDAHLRELLQDLHQDINAQIETEIQEFWHDLEISTNEKHQELTKAINAHLARLARDIEDVVGKSLDLKLEAVDIHMDPPSAQDFHNSIQDLFTAGIGKSTQIQKEMNEEEYVVWERKFRGLCKQSEYYVGRPAKKQVEIEKQVTTYQFQPEKIKEYFTNTVNSTIDTSIKYVRSYVHAYLMDNIEEARVKISAYGERYAEIMQAALATKTQSAEEQQAGLDSLEAHLQEVSRLLHTAALIQHKAAQMFLAAPAPCSLPIQGRAVDVSDASTEEVAAQATPAFAEGLDRPRGEPLPEELFTQPPHEAAPTSTSPIRTRDADRDMLEVFLNQNHPMVARQASQSTKGPSPTPAEEEEEDEEVTAPKAGSVMGTAVEEAGYICPGPVGHSQPQAATDADNMPSLVANPFNFLLEQPGNTTHSQAGSAFPTAPSPAEPVQRPAEPTVEAVRAPSLVPHPAAGSEHSGEVLPLSDRRKSMDSRDVYSASSIASASASPSPMHASAVLPEDAQEHAEDVSRAASLASDTAESEWECVGSDLHTGTE